MRPEVTGHSRINPTRREVLRRLKACFENGGMFGKFLESSLSDKAIGPEESGESSESANAASDVCGWIVNIKSEKGHHWSYLAV